MSTSIKDRDDFFEKFGIAAADPDRKDSLKAHMEAYPDDQPLPSAEDITASLLDGLADAGQVIVALAQDDPTSTLLRAAARISGHIAYHDAWRDARAARARRLK